MRLWHESLIEVLPRQQLLGQWRELNSIYKKEDKHILINFIYEYPKKDLLLYSLKVILTMQRRGYNINLKNFIDYFQIKDYKEMQKILLSNAKTFVKKMNERYLLQCYYNLQEKYDCGGITEKEWNKINQRFYEITKME
jgi:uncharacterized protein (TIGR02328 family)|nr:MAG TPA: Pyrimidine dimer DNA glycosylase [Caudoviricetes sp.]